MSKACHDLKFIFIHVPKCAGTSMEWVKWNRGGGHVTLQTFYDRFLRQS